ncbi:hypothetical protein [Arsenicicoccus dermatophilus]|uniref:hypothetical protein n=1 Tax=Arsenicicoccus dermatophilus TaxID=1076331 RepID=UPI001F4D1C35|nr:hypothetical protein [Arsenicicoccus dermatophilus]MCH8613349.1 hypothetical protein [Arsenicicoccus dermatophilus]
MRGARRTTVARACALAIVGTLTLGGCTGEPLELPPTPSGVAPRTPAPSGSPPTPSPARTVPPGGPQPVPTMPGGDGPQAAPGEAEAVLDQVSRFVAAATSLHAVGTLNHGGVPMTFDLAGTRDGLILAGTVSVGTQPPVEIRRIDGVTYVRSPRTTATARGRFVRMSSGPATQLGILGVGSLVDAVQRLTGHRVPMRMTSVSYAGRRAQELALGRVTTLVVAADGSGRLLKVQTTAGPDAGSIEFDRWDERIAVATPRRSQVTRLPGG